VHLVVKQPGQAPAQPYLLTRFANRAARMRGVIQRLRRVARACAMLYPCSV